MQNKTVEKRKEQLEISLLLIDRLTCLRMLAEENNVNGGVVEQVAIAGFFESFGKPSLDIPQIVIEKFGPLVFKIAKMLAADPVRPPECVITPGIDELLIKLIPDLGPNTDVRKLLSDFIVANSYEAVFVKLCGLTRSNIGSCHYRWEVLVGSLPPFAELDEFDCGVLLSKFDFSEQEVAAIIELASPKPRDFFVALFVLSVMRTVQIRTVATPTPPTQPAVADGNNAAVLAQLNDIKEMMLMFGSRLNLLESSKDNSGTVPSRSLINSTTGVLGANRAAFDLTGGAETDKEKELTPAEAAEEARRAEAALRFGFERMAGSGGASSMSAAGMMSSLPSVLSVTPVGLGYFAPSTDSQHPITTRTKSAQDALIEKGSWNTGPLQSATIISLRASYCDTSVHRPLHVLRNCRYSPEGLVTYDVSGIPHTDIVVAVKRTVLQATPPLRESSILNLDKNLDLLCLGDQHKSPYMIPASPEHFARFIDGQLRKVIRPSSIQFKQTDVAERTDCLLAYQDKFLELIESTMGPRHAMQGFRQHVTVWAVLVSLHINLWMRAMLMGDLELLVKDFDAVVERQYALSLKLYPDGQPRVELVACLQWLYYCCDMCHVPGASNALCSSCKINHLPKQQKESTGFQAAFQEWKRSSDDKQLKALTESKDTKGVKARFIALHPQYTEKAPAADSSSDAVDYAALYLELAKRQDLITMLRCPGSRSGGGYR